MVPCHYFTGWLLIRNYCRAPCAREPGGGRVASPHCFNPGARGHARMLFVSVCVSVGGLNFDPAYVWVGCWCQGWTMAGWQGRLIRRCRGRCHRLFLADVWAASRVSVVKHKPGCVSSQLLLPVFIQRGCVQQFVKHLQVLISFFVDYMWARLPSSLLVPYQSL